MKINEIKDEVLKVLDKYNIKGYDTLEIYKIISYVLDMPQNKLNLLDEDFKVSHNKISKIKNIIKKVYVKNIPIQYILKKVYFYNEEYIVNKNVLIPRPDTEILAKNAIDYINKFNLCNMIDMCTGSGCIGISCAKNSNINKVLLVDISNKALRISKKNIKLNLAIDKCKIKKSNLFSKISDKNKFDLIVSNPPYIKRDVLKLLDESVKKEPIIALNGGVDGLDFYRRILENAKDYLNDGGYIMFEIGYDELNGISKIILNYNHYEIIENIKDYSGNDRVVICRFHQK